MTTTKKISTKKTILGKPSVQTKKNTVTQSMSFDRALYEVMEANRPKRGPNQYRSVEITKALEFYYAFFGKLPKDYEPADPREAGDAVKAAGMLALSRR